MIIDGRINHILFYKYALYAVILANGNLTTVYPH